MCYQGLCVCTQGSAVGSDGYCQQVQPIRTVQIQPSLPTSDVPLGEWVGTAIILLPRNLLLRHNDSILQNVSIKCIVAVIDVAIHT